MPLSTGAESCSAHPHCRPTLAKLLAHYSATVARPSEFFNASLKLLTFPGVRHKHRVCRCTPADRLFPSLSLTHAALQCLLAA
ncbi:hypothetical protein SJ05684_c07640 [Sinorhizobium sojae CCBAU 05684]|uniref:Uncharacterized protein n=1 Tax=Sinorhizobium sojae CCBAU 05684 TaxID=716928 RepID=A0A249P944_9HYPH|nr:hypothetical protein SJ05684_c07640 [Sinorhizobium sojae CCBAU 05684]